MCLICKSILFFQLTILSLPSSVQKVCREGGAWRLVGAGGLAVGAAADFALLRISNYFSESDYDESGLLFIQKVDHSSVSFVHLAAIEVDINVCYGIPTVTQAAIVSFGMSNEAAIVAHVWRAQYDVIPGNRGVTCFLFFFGATWLRLSTHSMGPIFFRVAFIRLRKSP